MMTPEQRITALERMKREMDSANLNAIGAVDDTIAGIRAEFSIVPVPTRQEVMASWSVHNLTKAILTLSVNKDCVDVVHDTELALAVLKAEMDAALGTSTTLTI